MFSLSEEYCEQCDKMYTENKIEELYESIQAHKDTKDDEVEFIFKTILDK